jgi:uncharacterized repeat protein (TIGR03803 family)
MSHVPTKMTARLVVSTVAAAAFLLVVATDAQAAVGTNRWLPSHSHTRKQTAWSEQIVYSFQAGTDGANPWGDLVQVGTALYGTTLFGGAGSMGTVFKLTPTRTGFSESVVHPFLGSADGAYPWAGLSVDLLGSLYGTTGAGGSGGAGTVYKLTGNGQSILYGFQGGTDGSYPTGFPNVDLMGNVYGTTETGGSVGYGTVFALTPKLSGGYSEQILYSFQAGGDGQNPHGGLLEDGTGSLFGTTVAGGTSAVGTVFKLTPSRNGYRESILHSFAGSDGTIPNASLIADVNGALYGTATWGGSGSCPNSFGAFAGCGTVFKLTPKGNGSYSESTLYKFQGGANDGAGPNGDLFVDGNGNLYGTTYYGGAHGGGAVFMLTPRHNGTYSESVIWGFGSKGDGARPAAGMTQYGNALYGTTVYGGANGRGTVFQLTP